MILNYKPAHNSAFTTGGELFFEFCSAFFLPPIADAQTVIQKNKILTYERKV